MRTTTMANGEQPQVEDEGRVRDFADRAIREALVQPDNLRDFMELAAPEIADRFLYEDLEVLQRERLLDDWKRLQCDVLVRLPFIEDGGATSLVGLLVEHQSAPDQAMPFRSLEYGSGHRRDEWRDWNEEGKGRGPLLFDPIFAIVFHTGPRPWTAQRTMSDLVRPVQGFPGSGPAWAPHFVDLNDWSVEGLLESPRAFLKALAVVRADHATAAAFLEAFEKAVEGLLPWYNENRVRWHELMKFVTGWARHRRPRVEFPALIAAARAGQADAQAQREVSSMFITIAEEDRLSGARQMVSRVLSNRFGETATKTEREAIAALDDFSLLNQLIDVATTGGTIEDVRTALALPK